MKFLDYIKQQRNEFVKIAGTYPVSEHLTLRTEIDSLLIAYDQMAGKLADLEAKTPENNNFSEQEYITFIVLDVLKNRRPVTNAEFIEFAHALVAQVEKYKQNSNPVCAKKNCKEAIYDRNLCFRHHCIFEEE